MQTQPEETTAPRLRALLAEGALAGEWVLDPGTSSIALKSSLWGVAPVNGTFREVRGNGAITADGEVSGTVTVGAASIDTNNSKRDTHLRSADFLDSDSYPEITFAAHSVQPAGQGALVTGELTVRGRARSLSFEAAAAVPGDGQVQLDARVRVNRGDFGLTWNKLGAVSMRSTLTIRAVFTRR